MARERYWRPGELAAELQVSPKTITRWIDEGKIAHQRTLGGAQSRGHARIPDAEVQRIIKLFETRGRTVEEVGP